MLHHYVMIPWSHGKREEFDFDRENQSATILSLISAHELHLFFFLNWYWFIFMWFWKGSDSVPKTQDGAVLQRAEKEILHYRWKPHFFLLVNNLMWDKLLGLKLASARFRAPLGPLKDSAWPSAVWHISHPIKMLTEILKLDKNSKNQSSDD